MLHPERHAWVRPRRLFVSGGSTLPRVAAEIWTELGRQLTDTSIAAFYHGPRCGRRDLDHLWPMNERRHRMTFTALRNVGIRRRW